jgi:hypothetical protein
MANSLKCKRDSNNTEIFKLLPHIKKFHDRNWRLMLFKYIVTVYAENLMKSINELYGKLA